MFDFCLIKTKITLLSQWRLTPNGALSLCFCASQEIFQNLKAHLRDNGMSVFSNQDMGRRQYALQQTLLAPAQGHALVLTQDECTLS